MKSSALVLFLSAAMAAHAQTAPKPATSAAKTGTAAKSTAGAAAASVVKYPRGVKADPSLKKTLVALKYQDLKIGTGPEAEPMKLYTLKYTGWRASDGVVFDAWDQHPVPVTDKDGKPVMGDDGKPKMGDPQPAVFPVGLGRMIPGFDQGFTGMKVGGKRRIFIPWQLGYGARSMPDRGADHPGIPAKSDLVFDVELISMQELPAPASHPPTPGAAAVPGGAPQRPAQPTPPPSGGATAGAGATSAPSTPPPPPPAEPK